MRNVLAPYWERLRSELEQRGGTVEKFIGDAVMALFGAPVAHDDDPLRAVGAALAIRDWARDEEDLADAWALVSPDDEAVARLEASRQLAANGRTREAGVQLERGLAFFRAVGATKMVRDRRACNRKHPRSPRSLQPRP